MLLSDSNNLFSTQVYNPNMRYLTKARTTNKTKKASPFLRFRFSPEFMIHGIAYTKSHCFHNKALGCHAWPSTCVWMRWTDILVFPLVFNLCNLYATVTAKPAIPAGINDACLAFWISLGPLSSTYGERETSVLLDIVAEESTDNYKMSQAPTSFC